MIAGLLLLLTASPALRVTANVPWYGQCGGADFEGSTTCDSGSECTEVNDFYSQCVPLPNTTERPGPWEQCGGSGYTGFLCGTDIQCCSPGLQCVFINDFFSQCIPESFLADVGEPCGAATEGNTRCLLQSRASGPTFIKCSSETDTNATCVLCGFRGQACCPEGVFRAGRPQCQAAPRFTPEIPCNEEDDICEGDIIDDYS
eukprot:jgi/Ulvmu1/853/UM100_0004.1